jgi:hypothetical protein
MHAEKAGRTAGLFSESISHREHKDCRGAEPFEDPIEPQMNTDKTRNKSIHDSRLS